MSLSRCMRTCLLVVALLAVNLPRVQADEHATSTMNSTNNSTSGAVASNSSSRDIQADPQVDALLQKLKEADKTDCAKQTLDERTALEQLTRDHFNASCRAAFAHQELDLFQRFNRTQLYLGKCLQGSHRWAAPLVGFNVAKPSDDVDKFTEFALLYQLKDEAGAVPGSEIGGTIADNLFWSLDDFARSAKLTNVSDILLGEELQYYSDLGDQLCAPGVTLRFCLLRVLYRQRNVIDTVDVRLGDSQVVSRFDGADLNRDLKTMAELYKFTQEHQKLDLEVVTQFDSMIAQIKSSADSSIDTITSKVVASAFDKVASINDEFMTKASEDNRAEMLTTEKAAIDTKYTSSKSIMTKVDAAGKTFWPMMEVIGKAALDEEKSREHHSFWGFLKSIVKLVFVVFDPSVIGDFVESVHKFSNDLKGADNVRALMQLTKILSETMKQKGEKLGRMQKMLNDISAAVAPIMEGKADADALKKNSEKFLQAMRSYEDPVSPAEIDGVVTTLGELRSEFCTIAGNRATSQCAQSSTDFNDFLSLSSVVQNSREILRALREMASDSVRTKSAEIFGNAVNATNQEATKALDKLRDSNGKSSADRKDHIALLNNHFLFGQTAAKLKLIMTSVNLAKSVYQICNVQTYLNGGVPLEICNAVYAIGAEDVDIKKIQAVKDHVSKEPTKLQAFIPTVPAYAEDSAYIDLQALMAGQSVNFQLPSDELLLAKWIRNNNWIPEGVDLKSTTGFITKMQLILPPTPQNANTTTTVPPQATDLVSVTIETSDYSDMGPALSHKRYQIPTCSFVTEYRENSRGCSNTAPNPYAQCGTKLSDLCIQRDGSLNSPDEHNLLPSMFSPFRVKVNSTNTLASAFEGINASMPLAVNLAIVFQPITPGVWATSRLAPQQVDPTTPTRTPDGSAPVPPTTESTTPATLIPEAPASSNTSHPVTVAPVDSVPPANSNATSPTPTAGTRRRALQSTTPNVCCKEDSYIVDMILGTCSPCPAGSQSQFGGLYCVPQIKPSKRFAPTTNGSSNGNDTSIPMPSPTSSLNSTSNTTPSPNTTAPTPTTAPVASLTQLPTSAAVNTTPVPTASQGGNNVSTIQ